MSFARLRAQFSKLTALMILTAGAAQAHAGWRQTFNEDFTGAELDLSKWQRSDYYGLRTSIFDQDKQCYLDQNVSVADGQLHLTALNEVPAGCNPDPGGLLYTSGQVSTGGSFNQAYGYFEVRMKAPKGAGLLSQFRLGIPGGSFPPLPPEFLPIEAVGADEGRIVQRYSTLDLDGNVVDQAKQTNLDYSSDYHVYGMDWTPGRVIYYVDGKETHRIEDAQMYNQPVYLILNLAVGSTRAGAVNSAALPGTLDVDYVRVYTRFNDGTDDTLPPGVQPPAPVDTSAPVVKVLAPSRITFGSTVTLTATASDNVGVSRVTFLVDGKQVCTVSAAPFVCKVKFDEKVISKPSVTITARASDAAGNVGQATATSQIQLPILLVLISLAKAILKAIFGLG